MPTPQNKTAIHALTLNSQGIANCIITPVEITNLATEQSIKSRGIWDTGATNSVITKTVAESLGLTPVRMENVRGVHGVKAVNVYYVKITLNNTKITLNAPVTECDDLSADNSIGMLIGMNIINMGDFSITNFSGRTTMSFRVPSVQRIDFVAGMKNHVPVIKDKVPGRNDPCNCGSGKKYKHCHGKTK